MDEYTLTSFSGRQNRLPLNLDPPDLEKYSVEPFAGTYECKLRNNHKLYGLSRGFLLDSRWNVVNRFNSANPRQKQNSFRWQARRRRLLTYRTKRWEDAIWPNRLLSTNIFNWLADTLPILYLLKKQEIDIPVVLLDSFRKSRRDMQSLEPFNGLPIEFLKPGVLGIMNNTWITDPVSLFEHGRRIYNGKILLETAEFFKQYALPPNFRGPERIYISRQRSRRRLTNAEQVENLLQRAGFTEVFLEDLDFWEQIRTLASAKIMVSVHGAGMGNMIFQPAGATIIELTKPNIHGFFSQLADALGHDFYYLNGSGEPTKNSDIFIDILKLEKLLKRIGIL